MEDLEYWAKRLIWDDEPSRHMYAVPLKIDPQTAQEEGKRLAVGNPPEEIYEVGPFVCALSPQSHIGPYRHAIDFLVPDGTPVIAAWSGIIVEVQESSIRGGPTKEFRDALNYVTISHANGEYSQYCHLMAGSVSKNTLKVGSVVRTGQEIATVGKTGWTDRDHLHFIVFRRDANASPFTFKSLGVFFEGIDNPPIDLSL